jgi:hypothetical protein
MVFGAIMTSPYISAPEQPIGIAMATSGCILRCTAVLLLAYSRHVQNLSSIRHGNTVKKVETPRSIDLYVSAAAGGFLGAYIGLAIDFLLTPWFISVWLAWSGHPNADVRPWEGALSRLIAHPAWGEVILYGAIGAIAFLGGYWWPKHRINFLCGGFLAIVLYKWLPGLFLPPGGTVVAEALAMYILQTLLFAAITISFGWCVAEGLTRLARRLTE